ncbi:MAG: helix-turn-helix transcriptional regulator [Actinomycetota bacterium]
MAEATLGERVADARKRKGLSQKDLATLMGRSESWVSQVERDVLPVDRLAIRQKLSEVLGVSFLDPAAAIPQSAYPTAVHTDLDELRSTLTGHPALAALLDQDDDGPTLAELESQADDAWKRALDSDFGQLAQIISELEQAARQAKGKDHKQLLAMLARSYQAASAGFARQNEADAAWLAGDRALTAAEESGDVFAVIASQFRLAHTFMRIRRFDQARLVAVRSIDSLNQFETAGGPPEALSLYGAMHLVLAALAGFDNDRTGARAALDEAERIAGIVGEGRNDYDTEFGPINVQIHRISIAVDLGDAGEAIEIASRLDPTQLSNERQMRVLLDTARAHGQRRQIADAVACLLEAERTAPEHLRSHTVAHQTVRDLLGQRDAQASEELADLARRLAVLP